MSDDSSLQDIVVEEATDQIDIGDVLGEGSLEDEIDAEAIGASAGARLGEQLGRSLGENVGEAIHESFSQGVEQGKGLREMLADASGEARGAFVEALTEVEDASGVVTTLRGALEESGAGDQLSDVAPTDALESGDEAAESDEESAESAEESSEGAAESAEEATDEETTDDTDDEEAGDAAESDQSAEADSGPSTDELEDLRRETLEDFLDVMSYDDLQSVAKEVGVKANLSREEMTDEIVETVAGDESEEASDGENRSEEEAA